MFARLLHRPLATLTAAALALAACSTAPPPRVPPQAASYAAASVPGVERPRFWGDASTPEQRARSREVYHKAVTAKWRAAGSPEAGVEMNVLALSGGGPDGAFAAGLLAGWTAEGSRPEFDLVTGISVGALIAPFAFLGPAHDAQLRRVFTELGTDDVVILKPVAALFGALGVADTLPLRQTLRGLIDDAFLRAVAATDAKGRSLLIGTTHIDSGRPVIWDMGAIARAGDAELFRDVMVASASIPGAFPPVGIEVEADGARFTEFHVDGGVTHSVIVWPAGYDTVLRADFPFPVRQTVFVIQNNPLEPAFEPVEASLIGIATRSLSTLIRSQSAGDLRAIHEAAQRSGSDFRLTYVPPGFSAASTTDFDTEYMRRLYEAAFADARDGIDWLDRPPAVLVRAADTPG